MLDPLDRAVIETRFGVRLREIYMATEGLLGVACEHGTLHLCEDTMKFEWEDPMPGSGLLSPLDHRLSPAPPRSWRATA